MVRKHRYTRDGWEIDIYCDELEGLIIAERELASVDEPVNPPPWLHVFKNVTSWLSNQQLADLARFLRSNTVNGPIRDYICNLFVPHNFV